MLTVIKKGISRDRIQKLLEKRRKNSPLKGIDLKKYCGVLNLKADPLLLQNQMRDEWE